MSDMAGEHVLICVAWPYANGPLHLGHVAGCYLPPDIQARFERAKGNRVLMVSGSDEHGTPITITAEQDGLSPQEVVDKYHAINKKALLDLGCSWEPNIDHRGIEFGGSLFNRTSDIDHKTKVQQNFSRLFHAGLFESKTTKQFYEVSKEGEGRFLPDRYVEGTCPNCQAKDARGDQCDSCGATYEALELKEPRSKLSPTSSIEIRDTQHLFYRLEMFQNALEQYSANRQEFWNSNVKAMTKQQLEAELRPRAVTRDLNWGISIPFDDDEWQGKCVYVWFEAVQGYLTCAQIWAERFASDHPNGLDAWENWWKVSEDGQIPRHLYFLGKDNIPFHTIIWPALIMGLNTAHRTSHAQDIIFDQKPGDLALGHNVPAMHYLLLAGGQFSKSRKHAVWLPSFLEQYDPDTLRYYLSINMPENHDTDFNWPDFVEKINSELIATYGNFVHRVLTLGHRLNENSSDPFAPFDNNDLEDEKQEVEQLFHLATESLEKHRFKESLRHIMTIAQYGNQMLQGAEPWKYMKNPNDEGYQKSISTLAFGWRVARTMAIATHPFMPASAQRLWESLGYTTQVSSQSWESAIDWKAERTWNTEQPTPLFSRLDLEEILAREQDLIEEGTPSNENITHAVKGGKKKKKGGDTLEETEGITYLDFETFLSVDLRTGIISKAENHPNADKLYVLTIDDGTTTGRTICAGLKEYYSIEQLEGKQIVFVANLKPRPLRGVNSQGMILAADDGQGSVSILTLESNMAPGSKVR
jgi:methionyl-tRNA synthetase